MSDKIQTPTNAAVIGLMRQLLATPDRWIKHLKAADKSGEVVSISAKEAHCFCLSGALHRAQFELGMAPEVHDLLTSAINCPSLIVWNDSKDRTFDEVRTALVIAEGSARAIDQAKKKEIER